MLRLQLVRLLLFYLEKFYQIDSKFTPSDIWPVFSMAKSYLKKTLKIQKLTKIAGGKIWSDYSFFTKKNLTKLTANLPHNIYSQFLVW